MAPPRGFFGFFLQWRFLRVSSVLFPLPTRPPPPLTKKSVACLIVPPAGDAIISCVPGEAGKQWCGPEVVEEVPSGPRTAKGKEQHPGHARAAKGDTDPGQWAITSHLPESAPWGGISAPPPVRSPRLSLGCLASLKDPPPGQTTSCIPGIGVNLLSHKMGPVHKKIF